MARPPSPEELLIAEAKLASGAKPPSEAELQGNNGVLQTLNQLGLQLPGVSIASNPAAFGKGIEQGASSGFADEVRGAGGALSMSEAEKAMSMYGNALFPGAAALPWMVRGAESIANWALGKEQPDLVDRYTAHRDLDRSAIEEAKQTPGAYIPGELLGAGIQALAPVGNVATAGKGILQTAKTVGKGALTGGAFGGAGALGASDADLTKGEFSEALSDVTRGAAPGAILGGGATALAKGVGLLSNADDAALQAYRAAHPELTQLKVHSREQQIKIGRRLLDEKLIEAGDTTSAIAERLTPAREKAGREIGETIDRLTERMQAQGKDSMILQDVINAVADDLNSNKRLSEEATNILLDELPKKMKQYSRGENRLDFKTLREIKTDLQKQGRYESAKTNRTSETYRDVAGATKDYINAEASRIDPALGKILEAQNQRHWELSSAEDMATTGALKEAISPIRRGIDLAGVATTGALGTLAGGAGLGIPALVAAHLIRTRGRSSAAVLMDMLSKTVGLNRATKIMQQLGTKVGPTVIGEEIQ